MTKIHISGLNVFGGEYIIIMMAGGTINRKELIISRYLHGDSAVWEENYLVIDLSIAIGNNGVYNNI